MRLHSLIAPRHAFRHAATLIILVAVTGACGTNGEAANPPRRGPGGNGGPSAVEIATVEKTSLARTSVVTGQLAPVLTVGVNSQVGGALLAVNVEEGSRVRKGDVLAEIDPRELTAQVRAAEAQLALARSTSERSEALHRAQVITSAEYDRDLTALAAAEATAAQLQTRLAFTRVTSPLSGVVTQRFVRTGDIVGAQSPMFTVADVSTLVTLLPVSELEVPFLRTGARVPVSVDALGQSMGGRIRRIFPAADSSNRLVPVEVAVDGNALPGLRPGYTVRASLRLDERNDVLVVSSRAVVGAAGAQSVYLVRDGRAERRMVRVGADIDGRTEVLDGLVFGDTVITTGNALLRDGSQVRIVEPLGPDTPGAAREGQAIDSVPAAAPTAGETRP